MKDFGFHLATIRSPQIWCSDQKSVITGDDVPVKKRLFVLKPFQSLICFEESWNLSNLKWLNGWTKWQKRRNWISLDWSLQGYLWYHIHSVSNIFMWSSDKFSAICVGSNMGFLFEFLTHKVTCDETITFMMGERDHQSVPVSLSVSSPTKTVLQNLLLFYWKKSSSFLSIPIVVWVKKSV